MVQITHAFFDLDSVPHLAASVAEKDEYQWVKNDKTEQSIIFKKADLAAQWFERQSEFGFINGDEWTRDKLVNLQDESVALKAVERDIKSWKDAAINLTGNSGIIFRGFISASGRKSKDLDHLEDRYQYNRYDCRETWIPQAKKTHHQASRDHLLSTCDWVRLGPKHIEADALAIYFAERRGMSALIGLKDKDLKQAYGTNFINMNEHPRKRILETTTVLGDVWVKEMAQKRKELDGHGFKFIMGQTMVGDVSDGYKGLYRYGPVKAVELLDKCETVNECIQATLDVYRKKYPKGHTYKDWNHVEQHVSADELASQHCQLAYHERGPKDLTNPIDRFLKHQPAIFTGY